MTSTLEEILGAEAIEAIRRPIESARSLPAAAYTSDAFFRLEQERLFPRTWECVGYAHEVPEPGDAVPLMISGLPIVLLRDGDSEIRAFHNVCRHRAMTVLREPSKGLSELQCPYHHWTYGLDGSLRAAPYFQGPGKGPLGGLEVAEHSLVPVRIGIWNQCVFLNLAGNAPPLEEYLAPISELYGDYDLNALQPDPTIVTIEFKANWKLLQDNWENYHGPYLHQNFMNMQAFIKDDELSFGHHADGCCTALVTPMSNRLGRKSDLPIIPGPPNDKRNSFTTSLFPSSTMTLTPNHFAPVIYTPIAPDRTQAKMAWFFAGDAATSPEFAENRKAVIDMWIGKTPTVEAHEGIRTEDLHMMEEQQIAHSSPVADQKANFSPYWEVLVHHFQKNVIQALS